eukprot:gene13595-18245_t
MSSLDPTELGLTFQNLSVSTPKQSLINDISGYVVKGGITAVLGPSAAGKSVLLRALAGRVQDLEIVGKITVDGHIINPKRIDNPVAYVPQEHSLLGELTAREVTMYTALWKRNESKEKLEREVNDLLNSMGLSHVCDGIIGTLIFRGLSGGQQKRAEICCELIASPKILLLDEPTSGLDSSIAFEVLSTIRDLAKASNGNLSVILTIHQPNSKILELFDHIMLLGCGSTVYFGTLDEAQGYFSNLGFICPDSVTPTDYFLQISDTNYSYSDSNIDFHGEFRNGAGGKAVEVILDAALEKSTKSFEVDPSSVVPFYRAVWLLVYRDYTLAWRDPTLYHFQFNLILGFALMIGMVFYQLPFVISSNTNIFAGGLLWVSLLAGWVHVFKVYHISKTDRRTEHELANNKYSPGAFLLADFITTSTLTMMFIPLYALLYFMMGFPKRPFLFVILVSWMLSLTSEAVFATGLFIAWNKVPNYWLWLQESTLFTHASRAMLMEVYLHLDFKCFVNLKNECYSPGSNTPYTCAYYDDATPHKYCWISGREFLYVDQGIGHNLGYWKYFGFLCCIFVGFKLCIIFLVYYPWERILYKVNYFLSFADVKKDPEAVKMSVDAKKKGLGREISSPKGYLETTSKDEKNAAESASSGLGLTWTKLSLVLPNGKKLIDDVSGYVRIGRVLALMGVSGAGKTTLLNGLANRAKYAKITGDVRYSGRIMTPMDLTYVPQFDEFNSAMNVEEQMLFVGNMTSSDTDEVTRRAKKLLEVLGLSGKKQFTSGGLSGGELKRVSVGLGMMSNPNVLFLDEPTTGLDSTAAYSIVEYLVAIAKVSQVAVILTIHQPSALVFGMLDDLLLLEEGKVVYGGTIADAKKYFAQTGYTNPDSLNPADYYLEITQLVPSSGGTWHGIFESSELSKKFYSEVDDLVSSKKNKPVTEFPYLLHRFFYLFQYFMVYFFKEKGVYGYRIVALLILALFSGSLYLNLHANTADATAYTGVMFFCAVSVMLTAVMSTAVYAKDRREAVN